jgi:hypothetical protein
MNATFATLTTDQITYIENAGIGAFLVSKEQIDSIADVLDLAGKTVQELAAIRNSVVRHLADLSSAAREAGDWKTFDQMHNNMSGITAVIDKYTFQA